MPDFFIILLKINIVLILFAVAYYLILRRLTFYVINRVFLVFGILFSTVYPFIDLTDFFNRQNEKVAAFVPKLNQKASALVPSDFISNYWQWISILFYVGVLVMAFRLVVQFISLYRMHQKSKPGSVANYSVRILDEPVSPFSFWQTVYINPALHKEVELNTILAHENIHVKEWHSLDIILAELSVVFYWFNPGVWLMKRAVKENLEFITDEKILKRGIDKKAYQYSLLDVGNLMPAVEIVNNFNLSDLKKRIKMMNVKRSSHLTLSRYLLVLPVLLTTTLAFTVTKKDIEAKLQPLANAIVKTAKEQGMDITITKLETTMKQPVAKKKKIKTTNSSATVDSVSKFSYVMNTIFLTIDSAIKSKPSVETRIIMKATTSYNPDDIVDRLHGRVAGIKLDSNYNKEKKDRSINVSVFKGVPLPENSTIQEIKIIGYGTKNAADSAKKVNGSINFVVNGKKVSAEELNNIKPEDIKDVRVQKTPQVNEIVVIGRKKQP